MYSCHQTAQVLTLAQLKSTKDRTSNQPNLEEPQPQPTSNRCHSRIKWTYQHQLTHLIRKLSLLPGTSRCLYRQSNFATYSRSSWVTTINSEKTLSNLLITESLSKKSTRPKTRKFSSWNSTEEYFKIWSRVNTITMIWKLENDQNFDHSYNSIGSSLDSFHKILC